jgi:hypothetical protein
LGHCDIAACFNETRPRLIEVISQHKIEIGTAIIFLAVIVLLCLIGSYFASVVFTALSVAAAIRRREMAPKSGLAAAANSSIMAPEPFGGWA